jgi:tetratricopeptide (TPR) repeat protein
MGWWGSMGLLGRKILARKYDRHDIMVAAAAKAEQTFVARKLAQQRLRAREAQQRKDWPLAEELWRQCAAEYPGDAMAAGGYISTLIYAGKLDKAETLAVEFTNRYPRNENGPMFFARLAEARGDRPGAIRHWRRAIEVAPFRVQALIRLGEVLVGEKMLEPAQDCADRLQRLRPSLPYATLLRAKIDDAAGDRKVAITTWRDAVTKFPGNAAALTGLGRALYAAEAYAECLEVAERLRPLDRQEHLRLKGLVLTMTERLADHTDYWLAACADFPANADFVRKTVHAALWAERLADAEAAFDRLVENHRPRAGDANFVIGLANIHLANGELAAARTVVRRFLKRLRRSADYRIAALKLSRLILACFPSGRCRGRGTRLLRANFERMVDRAPIDPLPAQVLKAALRGQESLIAAGAQCLFETDISIEEGREFIGWARRKLAGGAPFSFIRIDDGESNALGYEPELASHFEHDAAAREFQWWGRTLDPAERTELGERVRHAMEQADCVGIPTIPRILRDLRLEEHQDLSAHQTGRGLRAVLRTYEQPASFQSARGGGLLTSSRLNQDLQRWDLYPELFDGIGEIVAVSCYADLPDAMQTLFGAKVVRNILIPPRHASMATFGDRPREPGLLPLIMGNTIEQLEDWPRGRLVVVGAGYAGKVIIHEAKLRGGCVLDLGSSVDYWVGAKTRSYLDLARPTKTP